MKELTFALIYFILALVFLVATVLSTNLQKPFFKEENMRKEIVFLVLIASYSGMLFLAGCKSLSGAAESKSNNEVWGPAYSCHELEEEGMMLLSEPNGDDMCIYGDECKFHENSSCSSLGYAQEDGKDRYINADGIHTPGAYGSFTGDSGSGSGGGGGASGSTDVPYQCADGSSGTLPVPNNCFDEQKAYGIAYVCNDYSKFHQVCVDLYTCLGGDITMCPAESDGGGGVVLGGKEY